MSKRVRVITIVVAAALLSSCSGSTEAGGKVTVTAKAPTKAEGEQAAAAINLKQSDLAGYTASPADDSNDAESKKEEEKFATCVGASSLGASADDIADVSSDDFAKGELPNAVTVSSSVSVVKSSEQAAADVKAFQGSKATDCFKAFVQAAFAAGVGANAGVSFNDLAVTRLSPGAGGTDGTFGYRLTASVAAAGQTFPFEMSIEAALKKHTELTFVVFSLGAATLTDTERDALFVTLVTRLKASAV